MTASVCVVGAGVTGCAVARELAPAYEVAVVDRGPVAGGTTARAAGLITVSPVYRNRGSVPRGLTPRYFTSGEVPGGRFEVDRAGFAAR